MTILKMMALVLPIWFTGFELMPEAYDEAIPLEITFKAGEQSFSEAQKKRICALLVTSEKDIREKLPTLPKGIQVQLEIVDWNLTAVGGVTGRAETNVPPLVLIQISHTYPGGIDAAIEKGLTSTVYHEFHHLSRGWAIQDNKYGPGIDIATVNEGLAQVFAETYTGIHFEANSPPKQGDTWMKEILDLPKDASYRDWMFEHPDGRLAIGYRTGNYLIRKVMEKKQMNVLELSSYSPEQIIEMGGY